MRLVTSAVMATFALTLSACGGDDPPPPEPSTTATTPANPDATLPPMPEVAQEFTPNGAATFVRHYVGLLGYASATGDIGELNRLSDPNCGGCSDYSNYFRKTYADGGWIRGRSWANAEIKLVFEDTAGSESRATTTVTIASGSLKSDSSAAPSDAPESSHVITFGLVFGDSGWKISQFVAGEPA